MIVTVVTGREERGIVWIPLLMSNIIIHYVQLQAQFTLGTYRGYARAHLGSTTAS